jgi:NMD protein affecting ribosome stability and mRNA decay
MNNTQIKEIKHKVNVAWDKYCKSKRIPKSWKLTDLITAELNRNGFSINSNS